jgi:hypothetical protein
VTYFALRTLLAPKSWDQKKQANAVGVTRVNGSEDILIFISLNMSWSSNPTAFGLSVFRLANSVTVVVVVVTASRELGGRSQSHRPKSRSGLLIVACKLVALSGLCKLLSACHLKLQGEEEAVIAILR